MSNVVTAEESLKLYNDRVEKTKLSTRINVLFNTYTKTFVTIATLLCFIGVGLISYFVLIHQSLRLDESTSLWQTSHSIGFTLRLVAEDVHVPLYHIILHFWQLFFGHQIATVRLLSLLFFYVSIPLVYILARQVLSAGWSVVAMVIFSFLPFMDWYSNEARMYTLLALFSTLNQIYFVKIIKRQNRAWLGYSISALFGAYSHYFFSFNLVAQGIFYIFNAKRFKKGSLKKFIAVGLMIIIALLPWLIYFHALGSAKNTSPLLAKPSTVDFFNVFSQFTFGFQDNFVNTIILSAWPLAVMLGFFAIKKGQQVSMELCYIITATFVPIFLAFILSSFVSPFFLSRYMISCVAPLVILLVWFISNYSKIISEVAVGAIVILLVASSIQQDKSSATPVKEDYQGVATTLNQDVSAQDVVIISAPFTVYPVQYYYSGSAQLYTLPIWNRQSPGAIPSFNKATMPSQVKQIATNHHDIYLVLSQNQGYENTIRQYFVDHFKELSHKTYSPDLSLYVFQYGYYQVPPIGSAQTIIKPTQSS